MLLNLPSGHAVPGKCLKTLILKHLNQSPRKGILSCDPCAINHFPNNVDPEVINETVEDNAEFNAYLICLLLQKVLL